MIKNAYGVNAVRPGNHNTYCMSMSRRVAPLLPCLFWVVLLSFAATFEFVGNILETFDEFPCWKKVEWRRKTTNFVEVRHS